MKKELNIRPIEKVSSKLSLLIGQNIRGLGEDEEHETSVAKTQATYSPAKEKDLET